VVNWRKGKSAKKKKEQVLAEKALLRPPKMHSPCGRTGEEGGNRWRVSPIVREKKKKTNKKGGRK